MKSNKLIVAFSLLVWLLLNACSSLASSDLIEAPLPPERIALRGYSLLPPNEKGWQISSSNQSPNHLTLVNHRIESDDETLIIEASSLQYPNDSPSQFNEEIVKAIKESNANKLKASQRYKRLKDDLVLSHVQGMDCIRGYSIDEDYEAAPVKVSGKPGYMLLELAYISCFHPKDSHTGIRINYSQRYYPNHQDPNFLDKANAIFQAIEVTNP